jgi:hypothetical protein
MRVSIALLLLLPLGVTAQSKDEKDVLAAVQLMFDGMAAHSAEKLMAATAANAQFVASTAGQSRVITREAFVKSNENNKAAALERIWEPKVRIHGTTAGTIADVWAEYDYHRDGKFDHCGIDAFQLVKEGAAWKIVSVIWTSEKEGCKPSPLGPPKQ